MKKPIRTVLVGRVDRPREMEDLLRCCYIDVGPVLDVVLMGGIFAAFVFSIAILVFFPPMSTPSTVFWVALIAVNLLNGVRIARRYRWVVTWRTITLYRRQA